MSGYAEIEELFRDLYRPLVRGLTPLVGAEAAADSVQDAFVQVHRHWQRVANYDDPAAWLRRVAVNRALNERRRRARGAASVRLRLPDSVVRDVPASDVDLVTAVSGLPAGQRAVVCLHYLSDLSVADVAAALDVSVGTVKSQLHDARKALLARLEEAPSGS